MTGKPISAQDVALTISGRLREQINLVRKSEGKKSTKIEVTLDLNKEQLRELSARKHIREAFIAEVASALDKHWDGVEYSRDGLSIRDEEDADPDVVMIKGI